MLSSILIIYTGGTIGAAGAAESADAAETVGAAAEAGNDGADWTGGTGAGEAGADWPAEAAGTDTAGSLAPQFQQNRVLSSHFFPQLGQNIANRVLRVSQF